MRGQCSRPGCSLPHKAKGLCKSHYQAYLRHRPTAVKRGQTPPGEALRFINEVAMHHEGDECLLWPFGRPNSGYGVISVGGVHLVRSRYVCTLKHGPPPTPLHEAAHSCNNGHLGCISPIHLSWMTHEENMIHKIASGHSLRGEKNPGNILTEAQVLEIRRLKGTIGARKIGLRFGVCETTVLDIHRRKKWAWLQD